MATCSLLGVFQGFERKYCFHVQGTSVEYVYTGASEMLVIKFAGSQHSNPPKVLFVMIFSLLSSHKLKYV
jgi:hypothetical protein